MVIPAFALAYLLSSRKPWLRRLTSLVGAGALMLALSFTWVIIVDLVPAGLRPWVGSTQNDFELSLALGYNGLQRLLGRGTGPGGSGRPAGGFGGRPSGGFYGGLGGAGAPTGAGGQGTSTFPRFPRAGNPPQGGPRGGTGGVAGFFNIGNPGLPRLFTEPLGGQIAWLLPLALLSIVALATYRRFRPREDRQQQSLLLWGIWLLTTVVFFSIAGFFHQYYLSQMAPAIAAMSGIGIVTMWRQYRVPVWHGWLLPLALVVTAAEQIFIIASNPSWGTWLIPVIAIPTALGVLVLVILRVRPDALAMVWANAERPALDLQRSLGRAAVTVSLFALLAVPTVWPLYPALTNTVSDLPSAGATAMVGNADPTSQVNGKLISYLEAHQGTATYLVATPSSNAADPIILATGKAVMALGGFVGTDPILTVSGLKTLIKEGRVRYFLLSGGNTRATIGSSTGASGSTSSGSTSGRVINVGVPDGSSNSAVLWVEQNCSTVPTSEWQSSGATSSSQQLYVCTVK